MIQGEHRTPVLFFQFASCEIIYFILISDERQSKLFFLFKRRCLNFGLELRLYFSAVCLGAEPTVHGSLPFLVSNEGF